MWRRKEVDSSNIFHLQALMHVQFHGNVEWDNNALPRPLNINMIDWLLGFNVRAVVKTHLCVLVLHTKRTTVLTIAEQHENHTSESYIYNCIQPITVVHDVLTRTPLPPKKNQTNKQKQNKQKTKKLKNKKKQKKKKTKNKTAFQNAMYLTTHCCYCDIVGVSSICRSTLESTCSSKLVPKGSEFSTN